MEPKQSAPAGGIERAPAPASVFESGPMNLEAGVEVRPELGVERSPELGAVQAEVSQVAMPALPMPVVSTPSMQAASPVSSDDDTPITANDDDLIEKEWVDKAKKILAETKDDPHRRESEVSKLQIEYIRKRYGREIGVASDE